VSTCRPACVILMRVISITHLPATTRWLWDLRLVCKVILR
jgi:hypothetical protein